MAEFHVVVREIFIKTVAVQARDADEAKMRVNGGQGEIVETPRFLVQLNPEHWEVVPASAEGAAEAMEEQEGS